MRFLIDAQLPPLLARHLTDLGHEARHRMDVGLLEARDQDIWKYALDTGLGPHHEGRRFHYDSRAQWQRTSRCLGAIRQYDKVGIVAAIYGGFR